jgi:hypothetical protein
MNEIPMMMVRYPDISVHDIRPQELIDKIKKLMEEYGDTLAINGTSEDGEIFFFGERLETNEEVEARIERDKRAAANQKAWDLKQLAALKAQYPNQA